MRPFLRVALPVSLLWILLGGAIYLNVLRMRVLSASRVRYALRIVVEEIQRIEDADCRTSLANRLSRRWDTVANTELGISDIRPDLARMIEPDETPRGE